MQELIVTIVKGLVDDKDAVSVTVDEPKEDGTVVYHLRVAADDMGRVIGKQGRIAKAMGMKVIACDEYPSPEGEELGTYVGLTELLEQSDVIALHCPLTPENTGLVCRETIEKMKDGVIIINNSRGPLINEADLAQALNSGKVYAAGLDVVSAEPIRDDNPLLKAKNCFITPHISWAPKESRQRLMNIAVDNLKAFLSGTPVNVVNP